MFNDTLSEWSSSNASVSEDMVVDEDVLTANKERTNRHLRTRDLVMERSEDAVLIVMYVAYFIIRSNSCL